jgi:hypothetical protein
MLRQRVKALYPRRLTDEEIGDALEAIRALVKAGRPKWFIPGAYAE